MTTVLDIINRGLQQIGTRTNVTAAELANQSTNEAIQASLVYENLRDDLLRMAPWNFSTKTANLVYITSAPGTPENASAPTTLWQPGQPAPPWAYEYQYPVDCLRALWVIPSTQTGFAGGVPITTAVTGGASAWNGPPARFKVQNDQFVPVIGQSIVSGGTGYVSGEVITLATVPNFLPPIGAPAQILVDTVDGSGSILTAELVPTIQGENPVIAGSYFAPQPNPQPQGISTGAGLGATFNLSYGPKSSQRVILTNQEFATLSYIQQVTDPNLMDALFQSAWSALIGATLAMALTGDKKLANGLIGQANRTIETARTPDGNEGLTINNVTPDWIRVRGWGEETMFSGPYSSFDWGGQWPIYG